MFSPARTFLRSSVPFVALVLALGSASSALAVQAGASISLYPTNWGLLPNGELIDVMVVVNNTSTDTPATAAPNEGVDPVPALLTGPITVKLACGDPICSVQVAGKLAFVPVGGNGCVDKAPGVNTCSAAGPNDVVIAIRPAGITIPAGGSLDIATIRLQVIDNTGVGEVGLMAFTAPAAVQACSSSVPSVCSTCDASGCTQLVFGKTITSCPHACPERIIFRGDAADPDFFEFHSLIAPGGPIDPPNQPFKLFLSNPLFASLFSVPQEIPSAGENFIQQGNGTWTFRNADARRTGGIAFVKISRRDGMSNAYKIDIQAFDPALEMRATVPTMTVKFTLGIEEFETTNIWTQKPNGWLLNLP
jgi:hypothetical protein